MAVKAAAVTTVNGNTTHQFAFANSWRFMTTQNKGSEQVIYPVVVVVVNGERFCKLDVLGIQDKPSADQSGLHLSMKNSKNN